MPLMQVSSVGYERDRLFQFFNDVAVSPNAVQELPKPNLGPYPHPQKSESPPAPLRNDAMALPPPAVPTDADAVPGSNLNSQPSSFAQ